MVYLEGAILGAISGSGYALLAVSVTLMHRTTGVLSFAHASFAMLAAYMYTDLATTQGLPVGIAATVALAVTVAYAALVERVAIRPVAAASPAVKLIATLAVFALTSGVVGARYGAAPNVSPFLLPDSTVRLFGLALPYQRIAGLLLAVLMTGGLGWLLRASAFGIALRATADNPTAARLVGVSPARVARFNWAFGGAAAGAVGILAAPLASFNIATFPVLLTKAFTAALVGGLVSLPLALAGAFLIGALEGVVPLASSTPGARELALLTGIVVLLMFKRRTITLESTQEPESPSTHGARAEAALDVGRRLLGGAIDRARGAGSLAPLVATVIVAFAITRPATDEFWAVVGARGLFIAIEALGLVVLTGWAGQVSLMQGAYVGIGAFMTSYLGVTHDVPLELAIPLAALAGVAMGVLVGIPALRLSSLEFAIASVVFAAAASAWLFRRPGVAYSLPRGRLFGVDLFDSGNLYVIMLVVAVLLFTLAWNVRHSTFGALLIVCRDAPAAAEHFGVRPGRVRMSAFLFASFISSMGGSLFAILITTFNPVHYSLQLSILLLVQAVIGGSESLAGPIIAGFAFGVLPEILQSGGGQASAGSGFEILSGMLVLAIVVLRPHGLASIRLPRRRGRLIRQQTSLSARANRRPAAPQARPG